VADGFVEFFQDRDVSGVVLVGVVGFSPMEARQSKVGATAPM
jgi:hypothetical protein